MKKILLILSCATLLIDVANAQSLIAYYPFTTDATDASGNGYDGILYGNATANDTLEIGDNNTDYVWLPESLLSDLSDFTCLFKVKFNTIHTLGDFPANTILHAWGNNLENEFKPSQNQSTSSFQIDVKDIQPLYSFIAEEGKWYCFVIVRENDQVTLYVDGLEVGNSQSAGAGSLTPYTNGLVLGQEEDCIGGCFVENQSLAGKLDELAFYDYAFSSSQALESSCLNCGDRTFYPFTVDASDSSGHQLNGILEGGAGVNNGILSTGDNDVDYVSVPDGALSGLGNFDISFAAKFDSLHSNGDFPGNTVIHAWGTSNEDELKIVLDGNTQKFHVSVQGSQNGFDFFPNEGEWDCYHVQRKNDSLFVYVDNQLIGIDVVPSGGLQIATNGIVIGQEEDCAGGCFVQNQSMAGELDNFRINNCPVPIPKDEKCDYSLGMLHLPSTVFSIFPNPADAFTIVGLSTATESVSGIIATDGKIYTPTLISSDDSKMILSTGDLPNGIYTLQVRMSSQQTIFKKLVIIH